MARKVKQRTFDEAIAWMREHGFQISSAGDRTIVSKDGCSVELQKNQKVTKDDPAVVRVIGKAGIVLGGEVSALVDRGYQKFLKTSKVELPATAEHLKTLHSFNEQVREALGATSLYNEALGSVSDRYVYDRVKGREDGQRKVPIWERIRLQAR
jgi:hypothetical protein